MLSGGKPMRIALSVCCLPILLLACTGIRVSTDHDPGIDFERFERFAWLEDPLRELPRSADTPAVDPFEQNTLLDQRVRAEVEAALAERGFQRVPREEADFLLRYQVLAREVLDSTPSFVSGGYGGRHVSGGVGFYGGVHSYQQGTLVIDVIDPRTDRIAWRGWADRRSRPGHVDTNRFVAAVKHVMEKFPPDD